jgi:hypothetical protein
MGTIIFLQHSFPPWTRTICHVYSLDAIPLLVLWTRVRDKPVFSLASLVQKLFPSDPSVSYVLGLVGAPILVPLSDIYIQYPYPVFVFSISTVCMYLMSVFSISIQRHCLLDDVIIRDPCSGLPLQKEAGYAPLFVAEWPKISFPSPSRIRSLLILCIGEELQNRPSKHRA